MMPCFNGVCGSAGGSEYGVYFAGNCFEQFEYTDKISGIGYCHEIRPEFTTEETLLMRAEANLFLGNIDAAFDDLYIWNHEHLSDDESRNYNMIELTKEDILNNQETISNIRINDFEPVEKFYNQTQSIRLYYSFNDVDVDRYMINGEYTQTFLSAREIHETKIREEWLNRQRSSVQWIIILQIIPLKKAWREKPF